MVWDRGTWQPEDPDVDHALKNGELKFELQGKKLRGSWVLVRTKNGPDGRASWLLIKHKDGIRLGGRSGSRKAALGVVEPSDGGNCGGIGRRHRKGGQGRSKQAPDSTGRPKGAS